MVFRWRRGFPFIPHFAPRLFVCSFFSPLTAKGSTHRPFHPLHGVRGVLHPRCGVPWLSPLCGEEGLSPFRQQADTLLPARIFPIQQTLCVHPCDLESAGASPEEGRAESPVSRRTLPQRSGHCGAPGISGKKSFAASMRTPTTPHFHQQPVLQRSPHRRSTHSFA